MKVLTAIFALVIVLSMFVFNSKTSEAVSVDVEALRNYYLSRIQTPRPYPTPRINPLPTTTPTPKPTVKPNPTNTPGATNVQEFIMNKINEYRKAHNLTEVKTNQVTCDFARTRAREISANFSHKGFNDRVSSKTLPYSSYSLVTENLAMTSNYQNVVNMWINSPGHAENMRKDTPFVCVEQFGNYYAYEGWKP